MTAVNRNLIAFAALVGGWLAAHPAFGEIVYLHDTMGNITGTVYRDVTGRNVLTGPTLPGQPPESTGSGYYIDQPKVRIPAGPYGGAPSYIPGY